MATLTPGWRRRTASARRCADECRRTWSASGSSWLRVVRISSDAPSGSDSRRSRGSPSTRARTACSASLGPIARAASSALAPSGSSSALPSGSFTFTSGQDSRRYRALLDLADRAVLGLEDAHQAAQELVELFALLERQRVSDDGLLLGLRADGLVPQTPTFVRDLDDHAAPVVGVVDPADHAAALHVVQAVRHRAAGEPEPLRELPRLPAIRGAAPPEVREQLPLAVAQVVRLERLLHRAVDVVLELVDPLDDPLDPDVEVRELAAPDVEADVHRIGLDRRPDLCHALILHLETLDVKVWDRVSSRRVVRHQDT